MAHERTLTIGAVGDIILDVPEPETYFAPTLARLAEADVLIGHVETPYSLRGFEETTDVPSPPASPDLLDVLGTAGFDVGTLAGNHIADLGTLGIRDTIEKLRSLGVTPAGAGGDLDEARRPALVERDGVRVAVLSVNCVGPETAKATSGKAGAAFVDIHTVYGKPFGGPGGPPMTTTTFVDRVSQSRLLADVAAARSEADVVVVALHKGVLHTPAVVADYERDLAHAVVEAGADAVIAHHAHILKGVEFHRGRPILHGLGNFVTLTSALRPSADNSPERRKWVAERRRLAGFDPDPAMPFYPFHPESRNTVIAFLDWSEGAGTAVRLAPCWIDDSGRPTPAAGVEGERIAAYVADISHEAGFDVSVAWDGTDAVVTAG